MKILSVNAGSSSLKFTLMEMPEEKTIAILLQTIYTKKESGAKWSESPP